jgi:hypothetical protein
MNVQGKCNTAGCKYFGKEQLFSLGMFAGYGAGNDRVRCPGCGALVTVTQTVNPGGLRRPRRSPPNRPLSDGRKRRRRGGRSSGR